MGSRAVKRFVEELLGNRVDRNHLAYLVAKQDGRDYDRAKDHDEVDRVLQALAAALGSEWRDRI